MADNNHSDYLESLFKGIDIILEKRLDQVSFDSTIICTITDASNSKNGEYKVTDGTVTYKAYSDLDSYVAGQQVRVSVPMGDYTQKKFIVGKYVNDNDASPITFVSPLESVVNMSGNLVPLNTTASIKANGTERSVIIWNQRMEQSKYADLQANGIYNTIILKADFKTLLSNYDLVAGTYGLRLDLLVRPSVNSTGRIRRYVELSSKEMFGNPYAFSIFSTQAKTFGISTVGLVEGIELSLYQCGDFKDRKRGPIVANNLTDDIIVNNIELGFGSDIVSVDDNIVKIYTENDVHYKYHNPTDDTNLKKIGLLWYNKDEYNQYIGFSDGIYDADYDELEYLELARMDTRLLAQKGREGIPTDKQSLTLAANIEEAVPLIQKARDVANQDLYQALTEFSNKVSKIQPMKTELDKLLLSASGQTYIGDSTRRLTEYLTSMQEQYAGVLDYAWDRQTQAPADRQSAWDTSWDTKWYENVNAVFTEIRTNVNNALTAIGDLATTPGTTADSVEYDYTGYKGVYDIYDIRIKRILTTMDTYLGVAVDENDGPHPYNKNFPLDVLNGTDFEKFAAYQNKTEFKTYKEQDLSAYANKYCIYWYRYEKDYVSTDIEQLMPSGWRRLTSDELKSEADIDGINVGLSTKDEENIIDGKVHHAQVPEAGKGFFTFSMQPDLENEKFVALVFYNHNMYKSNELVFTNSDIIPDKTTLDKGDILIFEHGERSSDNFSLYSDLGVLMDAADEQYARQIKVHYDGLLAKDEAMVGAGIYWYIPNNGDATMLTFDKDYLINRGFTTDLDLDDDKKPEFSKDGYACFYKQIQAQKMCSGCNKLLSKCSCAEKTAEPYWDFTNGTEFDNRDFWYKIKRNYNESATQNGLLCEVRISEDKDPVNGEQIFTFGTSGTNGTKYTLDVVYTSTMIATTNSNHLLLDVFLKDNNGEKLPLYNKPTSGTTPGEAYNCKAEWYFRIDSGAIDVNEDSLSLCTVNGEEADTLLVTGLNVAKGHCGIVKVSADFAMPTGVVEGDSGDTQKKREVSLDCLQAIPWAAGNYYISGPTQIVYNNYGTLDNTSMFDSPYRLFFERDQYDETGELITQAHEQVQGVQWRIKYYLKNDDGEFEELADQAVTADPELNPEEFDAQNKKHNQYMLYNQYMPVINDSNGLTPSTLYLANLDCFAVVEAVQGNSILWEQPIIMVQNRYASAMLNSWDGKFAINEENGTVMATMLGAGRKSKNNTFEGVLMGNIALGTESDIGFENVYTDDTLNSTNLGYANHTGLGLYGFHDGAQSFGFNIEGSAFLGKAGKGRIIFNGNYGVIASANWFAGNDPQNHPERGGVVGYDSVNNKEGITRTSTAGMCIDLVNGHMDAYDFKLTGSRIHFNSHPEAYKTDPLYTDDPNETYKDLVGYLMRIGHDGKTKVDYAESHLTEDELKARATPGYMMMDGEGNLTMRVNSLYITEALGGTNLLQQTSPRRTDPVIVSEEGDEGHPLYQMDETGNIICNWDTSIWKTTDSNTKVEGSDNAIDGKVYPVHILGGNYDAYQSMEKPSRIGKYTLSGWVRSDTIDTEGTLDLVISNCDKDGNLESATDSEGNPRLWVADNSALNENQGSVKFTDEWKYFEYTIAINSEVDYFKVEFRSDRSFYMWHAMFEQGSVATTWQPSSQDDEAAVINANGIYDKYLNQDKIFNKLIKDPITGKDMVGIWMIPVEDAYGSRKELYINATYIAAGILRSNNWNGTLKVERIEKKMLVKQADGTMKEEIVKDQEGNTVYIDSYTVDTNPTQGIYMNLNEGKIWAAKFELTAGQNGSVLYLNSNPNNGQHYLHVGDANSFIKFTKLSDTSTSLAIASNIFTLTAGEIVNNVNKTIVIDSEAATYPLTIGDKFKVEWDGTATVSTLYAINGGQIAGWKINGTKLESATNSLVYLEGDSTQSYAISVSKDGSTSSFKVSYGGYVTASGLSLYSVNLYEGTVNKSLEFKGTDASIYGTDWYINNTEGKFATLRITDGALRLVGSSKLYFGESSYFYLSEGWVWLSGADFQASVIKGSTIHTTTLTGYAEYSGDGMLDIGGGTDFGEVSTSTINVTTGLNCTGSVIASGFYTKNYKFGVWDTGTTKLTCSLDEISLSGTTNTIGVTSGTTTFNGKVVFSSGIDISSVYASETGMEAVETDTIKVRTGGSLSNTFRYLKFVKGLLVKDGVSNTGTSTISASDVTFKVGGLDCTDETATVSQGEGTLTISISGTSPTLYKKGSGTTTYYTRSNGATRYTAGSVVRIYRENASGQYIDTYNETKGAGYTLMFGPYNQRSSSGVYCYVTESVSVPTYTAITQTLTGTITLTEEDDTEE